MLISMMGQMNLAVVARISTFLLVVLQCKGDFSIFVRSDGVEDSQGNCIVLVTCISEPIFGNLFWYAHGNGSSRIFTRHDGGNMGMGPYDDFTLDGVSDFQTFLKPLILNGEPFTEFNTTLAFNVSDLIKQNVTGVSCGSSSNMSIITTLLPNIKGDYLLMKNIEDIQLSKNFFMCNGTNIPFKLNTSSCINNSTSTLQWFINGTTIAQYIYNQDDTFPIIIAAWNGNNSYNVTIQSAFSDGKTINLLSSLELDIEEVQRAVVQCGSDFSKSEKIVADYGIPANVSKPSIVFSGCYTSVTCMSLVAGSCEIDIFLGEKRVATGSGSTNASIDLVGLSPNMQYSYKGSVHADVVYELERDFSTTEYADKWTDGILACVILGPVLMTLSIILCIGIGICLHIKWNDFKDDAVIKYAFFFILSLSSVLLVVFIVNFIAGVVEVSGNCDNLQQPLQILIAACVFSGFTVLLDLIFICGVPVYYVCRLDKNVQVKPRRSKAQETLHLYGVSDEVARQSDKHGLSEAEKTISTSGHRKYGENAQQGNLRVKESLHHTVKIKKEETRNIYDKINRNGSDTKEKENLPPSQYDSLNNGNASESQEYDALQHSVTVQQVPPGCLVLKDDYDHIKKVDIHSKNKGTINANKIAPTARNSEGHPQQNPQSDKQYKPSKKDTNLTKL